MVPASCNTNKIFMTLPNGPENPPFLQLIQWIGDPLTYMDGNAKKYGEIFTTRWGNLEPFVMIHNRS
jgi:cytochrome P450 family 110